MKNSKKRNTPKKKISQKIPENKNKTENITYLPFHETFPITLKYLKSEEKKVCYFQCKDHLEKYLERSKLKKNEYKIEKTVPKETNEKQ